MAEWRARDVLLARYLAHELAHAALGHLGLIAEDPTVLELEADELGVFYVERSGIGCRPWVEAIGDAWTSPHWPTVDAERRGIDQACQLAQRGERPPRRLMRATRSGARTP
jgi:hypothetical protein